MAKKSDRPSDMANDIIGAIRAGTSKWTRTRKTEERSPASRRYRYARMTRERGISLKEAAAEEKKLEQERIQRFFHGLQVVTG